MIAFGSSTPWRGSLGHLITPMPPAIPTVGIVQILTIKMFLVKCLWHVVHAAYSCKTQGRCGVHVPGHTSVQVYQDGIIRMVETDVFFLFVCFFVVVFLFMKILMQRMHQGW